MIPFELKAIVAGLLLVAAIVFVHHTIAAHDAKVIAVVEAQATAAALKDSEAQRLIENQRLLRISEDDIQAKTRLDTAVADAATATSAAERLRVRYATALANLRNAGSNPAPVAAGASAVADPGDLPADVLSRVVDAAGQLALEADKRGVSTLTCDGQYDTLTP